MNIVIFTGRMAKAPVLTRPNGTAVCKFTLLRNEYAGKEESGEARPERKVAVQFTAFRAKAEAIAENVMEGDQIQIYARVENNNFTDSSGTDKYEFNFIVEDFEFGAPGKLKREKLEQARG